MIEVKNEFSKALEDAMNVKERLLTIMSLDMTQMVRVLVNWTEARRLAMQKTDDLLNKTATSNIKVPYEKKSQLF